MMVKKRMPLIFGAILLAMLMIAGPAMAKYPERPITLVVGFSAGGSTDQVARSLAAAVEKILEQNVVVVNKPGGGGTIAASWLATTKPDGYNLAVMSPSMAIAGLTKKVPYNIFKDFTNIMQFGNYTHCLASLADRPWKDLKGMLEWGAKNPGKLTVANPGIGSIPYLCSVRLAQVSGVKIKQVPFKGGANSLAALLGGHVVAYSGPPAFWPHIKTGKVNFLAVYADERLAQYPDVPTVQQLGYDVSGKAPVGISAPAGLPEETRILLSEAFKKAMNDPKLIALMGKWLMPLEYKDGPEYSKTIKWMWDNYGALVDSVGLRVK